LLGIPIYFGVGGPSESSGHIGSKLGGGNVPGGIPNSNNATGGNLF
jgi:hypothetical protein